MLINFIVGGVPVEFFRDSMTGRAEARTATGTILLDDPFSLGTHVSFSLRKSWSFHIGGTPVVIEKKRPLLFAGFRPHRYRIFVAGNLVAEQTGT